MTRLLIRIWEVMWASRFYVGLLIIMASIVTTYNFKVSKRWDKNHSTGTRKLYLGVHSTNNPWEWGSAENNAAYLVNKSGAGAHFVVDDKEVWNTADETWSVPSVGGKNWPGFKPKQWLDGKVTNANSINWELCLGWSRDNTLIIEQSAAHIGAYLVKYGLEPGAIVRHYDVKGKPYPFFGQLYMTPEEWKEFYRNPACGYWDQASEDRLFYLFKLRCTFYYLGNMVRLGKINPATYYQRLKERPFQKWVVNPDLTLKPWVWPEYPIKGVEREIRQIN